MSIPRTGWLALGLLAAAAGCQRYSPEPEPVVAEAQAATANPAERYERPFNDAVTFEVGPDQLPPPDRTVAGTATADVRETVERLWPTVCVADAAGQPLPWVVTLETEVGDVEITLRPDLAPNHVRNLIALVRAGYYDGLQFDRIVDHLAEDRTGERARVHLVRFGCPAGTGDPGVGHIGYRLRSEFSDEKHEVGTVGFTRDQDPSSAGVRLYITLAPAPAMDGSYTVVGKVSKGLDVVERIAAGRLLPPEIDATGELPERPVPIRRATASVR